MVLNYHIYIRSTGLLGLFADFRSAPPGMRSSRFVYKHMLHLYVDLRLFGSGRLVWPLNIIVP
jgi:hypothetical protein